jgi:hypothetical protein
MANAGVRASMGVRGLSPQWDPGIFAPSGVQGKAPGRGSGAKPHEADDISLFGRQIIHVFNSFFHSLATDQSYKTIAQFESYASSGELHAS